MYKYLIIGNSVAAILAAEKIRELDKSSSLAMVYEEKVSNPYPRPLITYALAGKVGWSELSYRSRDFYRNYNIETFPGEKVIKLKPEEKKVLLESGKELKYDKLLLATGGKPLLSPIKGVTNKGVFTFTNLDDAHEVNSRLRFVKEAVVIGGGLIGLKVAEAFLTLGIKTTIVELMDRLLAPVLDRYAANLVKKIFEEQGASVLTGLSVTEILTRNGSKKTVGGVRLNNGKKIPTDIVIVATGVAPRKELAEEAEIKTNRGILVNKKMETSIKDIFAAGDVVESYDLVMETNRPLLIWPSAYLQGRVAASNMAGKEDFYEGGIAMNSTTFFGYPIASVGLANPEKEKDFEILETKNPSEKTYRRLVIKNDRLIGFITAGKASANGLLVNLIKTRYPVKGLKKNLLNLDLSLVDFPKKLRQSLLLSKEIR